MSSNRTTTTTAAARNTKKNAATKRSGGRATATPAPRPRGATVAVAAAEAAAAAAASEIETFRTLFSEYEAQINAINTSMAVIEFDLDGTVLTANDNFLNTLGYTLAEVQGKHHSLFVDDSYKASDAYRAFWTKLRRGEFDSGEYKRIGKGGREVWIQASYNPVRDGEGRLTKVVKYAQDITERSKQMADFAGQVTAIGRSNAVIEFDLDGNILQANDNFLAAVGYTLGDIVGKHHSLFVDESYKNSAEYREFWAKLRRGEFHSGEYKRLARGGKEIYISASYNPIRDRDGKVFKVVKYATDATEAVRMREEMALFKPMVENAKVNLMLCDLDYTIKYINPASVATLRRIEQHLPVKADQIVGQKIDIFHKDPAHQRAMLATDKHLPHNAKIRVGPEHLDLNAVAIYDKNGKYVGPMVNWSIITGQVKMADDFENTVATIASVVSSSSTELEASAQGMAASSEETSRQAQAVAAASEQATRNVQTVASSAEELTASIREIASRVQEASQISQVAVKKAGDTTDTMARLGNSSQEIGQVVKVITSIAQQTNLLALNATIEAARAGEAGKGFAVVANEVKELARQTAKATEEIGSKIAGVQSETNSAIGAIREITEVISKINEISTTIAGAVEEQNAATSEISRNVGEAARGTAEVSSSISMVTQVAAEGGRTAENIKGAASQLSHESERLNSAVTDFLTKMRAL
ncbi:methyl-accepting chemotaxis protein [Gemmatimonas phototrophica]|nr:PAS domain-containing methyl-accepting chemotaxis protein [Gemmatimonas phototrophica]